MPDFRARLRAVQQRMAEQGVDALFLSRSTNLHYLAGIPREEPNFGNTIYPGEWLTGAWVAPDRPPVLTLPRMLAEFHLDLEQHAAVYDVRVLPDAGDPSGLAGEVIAALGLGANAAIAVEDRAWAET